VRTSIKKLSLKWRRLKLFGVKELEKGFIRK
jgi:hypothetical protein